VTSPGVEFPLLVISIHTSIHNQGPQFRERSRDIEVLIDNIPSDTFASVSIGASSSSKSKLLAIKRSNKRIFSIPSVVVETLEIYLTTSAFALFFEKIHSTGKLFRFYFFARFLIANKFITRK